MAATDPLATADAITPQDLDGADLAMLFSDHATCRQTARAFAEAGCRFRRRVELQTVLPGLHFVAAGPCDMICDIFTAYSHLSLSGESATVAFRPFAPRIETAVSILTPAHNPASMLSDAFCAHLTGRVEAMQTLMPQPPPALAASGAGGFREPI